MPASKDLIGKTFNRLFVIGKALKRSNNGSIIWICFCNCGNFTFVDTGHIINGHKKSCGCLQKEAAHNVNLNHGFSIRKNINKFYTIWLGLKQRCNNKNTPYYKYYGGRGITYDLKWKNFLGFKEDMYFKWIYAKRKYSEGCLSIERINVNDNYCFDNCIFIPMSEQYKNKRRSGRNPVKKLEK